MFLRVFSLSKQVRRSLRPSGPGSQVYGYYRMSFQEEMNQHKKLMVRVCNLHREKVRSIKTIFFLIAASMSLSSEETVPKKWRPCQDKIMTITEATVENQEEQSKTNCKYCSQRRKTQTRLLEAIFCNRFKDIASLWTAKLKGCQEIKAIVQVLKTGRGDKDVIKNWS